MSVVSVGHPASFLCPQGMDWDAIVSGMPGDPELGICFGCRLKVAGWIEQSR